MVYNCDIQEECPTQGPSPYGEVGGLGTEVAWAGVGRVCGEGDAHGKKECFVHGAEGGNCRGIDPLTSLFLGQDRFHVLHV